MIILANMEVVNAEILEKISTVNGGIVYVMMTEHGDIVRRQAGEVYGK